MSTDAARLVQTIQQSTVICPGQATRSISSRSTTTRARAKRSGPAECRCIRFALRLSKACVLVLTRSDVFDAVDEVTTGAAALNAYAVMCGSSAQIGYRCRPPPAEPHITEKQLRTPQVVRAGVRAVEVCCRSPQGGEAESSTWDPRSSPIDAVLQVPCRR